MLYSTQSVRNRDMYKIRYTSYELLSTSIVVSNHNDHLYHYKPHILNVVVCS